MTRPSRLLALTLPCVVSIASAQAPQATAAPPQRLDCGYRSPAAWQQDVRDAVARGEIADPSQRGLPKIPTVPRGTGQPPGVTSGPGTCLGYGDVFPFEDTARVLVNPYSNGQLIDLMVSAANALLATHGDNYDFIGYWVNFNPSRLLGAAFYAHVSNHVQGIGDPSRQGTPIFDNHATWGLAGSRIQGFVMMWDINWSRWVPGESGSASFTRLALAQEFEHRWALYLPPLQDGRNLQGIPGCGRVSHWSWRVDGQGSGMEISEWVDSNPARLTQSFVSFNTDNGGVFSYTDLYLMGYASPAEMDAGNSELRYMHDSDCQSNYLGRISSFSSADIIATAGPRVPDVIRSQKAYRTAWIMIHQPGAPPTLPELDKTILILEQHHRDWSRSTLGRGTMDNSLAGNCARTLVYGCGVNPLGSMVPLQGTPAVGTSFQLGIDNPLGTQLFGAFSYLFLAGTPDPGFPCGTRVPGLGMRRGGDGELLVSLTPRNPIGPIAGPRWLGQGVPARITLTIPNDPALFGTTLYAQGLLQDPTPTSVPVGLTDAAELRIGR